MSNKTGNKGYRKRRFEPLAIARYVERRMAASQKTDRLLRVDCGGS
jgi:hypothetical protein